MKTNTKTTGILIGAMATCALAAPIDVGPGNIGDGSIAITGTGWAQVSQTLLPPGGTPVDLTTYNGGSPVALRAFVDLQDGADVAPGDWSKYYFKFQLMDSANRRVTCVFADGNLGGWYGIPAQIWQRLSLETEDVPGWPSNTPHHEQWYCREGGCTDFGAGTCSNGRHTIYPTDEISYVQLVADPVALTFTLYAYGNGNGGAAAPPASSNSTPGNKWWTIGSITVGAGDFDFTSVTPRVQLWSSTQAQPADTTRIHWYAAHLGGMVALTDDPLPLNVWVDDDFAGGEPPATPGWDVTRFDNVQDGVDAVAGSTINVAPGTYPAPVTIDKSVDIIGAGAGSTYLTGGIVIKDTFDGLLLEAMALSGDGPGPKNAVVDSRNTTAPGVSNITIRDCALDGDAVAGRAAFYGHFITGTWTWDGNEIKGFPTWYVIDNTGSAHDVPFKLDEVRFQNNHVHDTGGSIAFRGKIDEPMDLAIVSGNTFDQYPASVDSQVWAAIEVNNVADLRVYDNTFTDIPEAQWGDEGQALQIWSVTPWTVDIHDNLIIDNFQGIWIWTKMLGSLWSGPDTDLYVPGGSIHRNCFVNNTEFGLWISDIPAGSATSNGIGGPLDAEGNYWGAVSGPSGAGSGSGDAVSTNVDFDPWLAASPCVVGCGNGIVEGGEECDDGNLDDGDGCSAACTNECGDGTCDHDASDAAMYVEDNAGCSADCFCGDGALDTNEACDDGNNAPFDGCNPDCTLEVIPATSQWSLTIVALLLFTGITLLSRRLGSAVSGAA